MKKQKASENSMQTQGKPDISTSNSGVENVQMTVFRHFTIAVNLNYLIVNWLLNSTYNSPHNKEA